MKHMSVRERRQSMREGLKKVLKTSNVALASKVLLVHVLEFMSLRPKISLNSEGKSSRQGSGVEATCT